MSEKTKNEEKSSAFSGCIKYFLFIIGTAICIIATLVLFGSEVSYYWELIYGRIMANCSDIPEAVERTGILEFESSSESEVIITEENASRLVRLGSGRTYNERPYHDSLRHQAHDYVLELPYISNGSDNFSPLLVCSSSGELMQVLSVSSYDVAFSLDGQYFAAGNRHEHKIDIFDANTFELYRSIPHLGWSVEFAFHPTEPLLALATDFEGNGGFQIWNYETMQLVAEFRFQGGWARRLAFNENGTLLLVGMGNRDGATNIWGIAPE
jgi:WD40 repeat protein